MQSPLPDSSALEAGILEDERPTRSSDIQNNVRSLLRSSVFGRRISKASPRIDSHLTEELHSPGVLRMDAFVHDTSIPSPDSPHHPPPAQRRPPTLPPLANDYYFPDHGEEVIEDQIPARAPTVLHPDVEADDHALALLVQQKSAQRQRQAWRRRRRTRHVTKHALHVKSLICIASGLMLAALLATCTFFTVRIQIIQHATKELCIADLSMVLNQHPLASPFHIVFLVSMLAAVILFSHSAVRLCMLVTRKHKHSTQGQKRHIGRYARERLHSPPPVPTSRSEEFVPETPIQVHVAGDSPTPQVPVEPMPAPRSESPNAAFGKEVGGLHYPPPAYGWWRGSVRADPNLLHWQRVEDRYGRDAAAKERGEAPPGYISDDVVLGELDPTALHGSQEPEMFQVHGNGAPF